MPGVVRPKQVDRVPHELSTPGASTGRFPPLRTRTPDLAQVLRVAGVALGPRSRAVHTVEAVLSPPTP
ncbi:hypothetical protein PAL_GLEAN10002789 [Pteropus alecto]|uniref:Uncharacterized protein n=1 Tax=Pteropus alecto TaxID=9402 RepID=L5K898_PTEAL|nr:hypothetical protein PAL_GLEAN10002789 [Pteropus alecto]